MNLLENSCTVSTISIFKWLYCVNNYKGFFLLPHLPRKIVSKFSKLGMLFTGRDLNHFLTAPEKLCANNLLLTSSSSTSSISMKSMNLYTCCWAVTSPSASNCLFFVHNFVVDHEVQQGGLMGCYLSVISLAEEEIDTGVTSNQLGAGS
jgi:hypothetical protein